MKYLRTLSLSSTWQQKDKHYKLHGSESLVMRKAPHATTESPFTDMD